MPEYTSGYVTDDGKFFPDRKQAERHETKTELLKIHSSLNTVPGNNFPESLIDAILERYELAERYDYAAKNIPVAGEIGG